MEKLVSLVGTAYERGLSGCAELKKQEIEELLQEFKISEKNDFRIWKVEQLASMPEGTIFHHLTKGRCWLVGRANGSKFMQFNSGPAIEFNSDSEPWDKPMRIIYAEE